MSSYVIETQGPSTFLNKRGEPVQGFLIQGTLLPWDENFSLQVDVENKTISYRHSSGTYITVFEPNTLYHASSPTWMLIKLVVNVDNDEYERLHFNDQVVDISGNQGPVAASIWPSIVQISIRAFDTSGSKAPVYVDGVVLTIDEP